MTGVEVLVLASKQLFVLMWPDTVCQIGRHFIYINSRQLRLLFHTNRYLLGGNASISTGDLTNLRLTL